MEETTGHPFDLLLGRRTYGIFSAFWPTAPDEAGGKPLNEATKFVVSRGSPSLDWGPAELIGADAMEGVAELKQTDGPEVHVYGSGDLVQSLMRAGLVDEYRLMTFRSQFGTGKRLFADGTAPATLHVTESSVSKNGVVIARYEPAGKLAMGSILRAIGLAGHVGRRYRTSTMPLPKRRSSRSSSPRAT